MLPINHLMRAAVTRPAERDEVVEGVVSLFWRHTHAALVFVVDVGIVLRAAVLASVAIAFQSLLTIAAELVAVLGDGVARSQALWVCNSPRFAQRSLMGRLAVKTSRLRAASVCKRLTAIATQFRRAYSGSAALLSCPSAEHAVLAHSKFIPATRTGFLDSGSRLVASPANDTDALGKTVLCLSVTLQGARFAAPHIAGCFLKGGATIGALKKAVISHLATRSWFCVSLSEGPA
jgi:hypothetical protein